MRILLTFAVLILLAALMAAASFWGLALYAKAPGPLSAPKEIVIEAGTGVRGIAAQLTEQGVLSEPYGFMAIVALRDAAGRMQAGEYAFDAHVSLNDVLEKLRRGDVVRRLVTVPEGRSAYDVVQILNAEAALVGDVDVPPEGSVLPESYDYRRGMTRAQVLAQMQTAMTKVLDEAWEKRAPNLPYKSKEEALVMASIIEKETGVKAERERVAGVFVNRLRMGMRLQSDPTVVYGITQGREAINRVLYAHLEVDSPYNTYIYAGLPPTPIANPGKAAILAALNPEAHDYIYFVADGTGGHVFAKTLAEHNANVARWRALNRAR